MKAFVIACIAIVVIAAASDFTLNSIGFSTQEQNSGASVRLE